MFKKSQCKILNFNKSYAVFGIPRYLFNWELTAFTQNFSIYRKNVLQQQIYLFPLFYKL